MCSHGTAQPLQARRSSNYTVDQMLQSQVTFSLFCTKYTSNFSGVPLESVSARNKTKWKRPSSLYLHSFIQVQIDVLISWDKDPPLMMLMTVEIDYVVFMFCFFFHLWVSLNMKLKEHGLDFGLLVRQNIQWMHMSHYKKHFFFLIRITDWKNNCNE